MNEPRYLIPIFVLVVITSVITFHVATHLHEDALVRRELQAVRNRAESLQDQLDHCRRSYVRPGQPIGSPLGSPLVPEPEPTLAK